MKNWYSASLALWQTMQANNISYIGGYICGLAAGMQCLIMDKIIHQLPLNYSHLLANPTTYLPQHDVLVPPLVGLTTPRPTVSYGAEQPWITNPLHMYNTFEVPKAHWRNND